MESPSKFEFYLIILYSGTKNGKKKNKTKTKKDELEDDLEGELDIFGNKNLKTTDASKAKKKKVLKKIKKKSVPKEVENEGGDEEFGEPMPQINVRMPPEEEKEMKMGDPTIDVVSVTTKKKKKKIIRKKKKKPMEHAGTDPDLDSKAWTKDNNDKSKMTNKTNGESVSKSSSKSNEDPIEEGDEKILHRMPNQIDVFEFHRGYWTQLFFSNTFVN